MAAPFVPDSGSLRTQFALLLLLALAYLASARLGLCFPTHDSHITLFWLPTGMATAILFRWGSPYLIGGTFLGALLVELSLGTALPLTLLSAAGNTLAPLTAVWLLRRWRFDPFFTRQYDLLALVAAAVLSTPLPAAIGVGTLWLGGLLQPAGMPVAWLNWWLGDLMSILLVSPLLLSISKASLEEMRRRPAGVVLCALLLLAFAALAFLVTFENHILPLAFLPLPLVLWAALRLGATGASLSVLTLSLLTAFGTATNKGVFGTLPAAEGMYLAWLYMFVVALIGLLVTTLLGERKKIEASLQRANELLSLAQRTSRSGVWDWELAGDKLSWSNEMYALFGLDPQKGPSFDSWRSVLHPEDRQAAEDKIGEALRTGIPLFNEYRIRLPDGTGKWILAVGDTSRNERNEPVRMSGLCIDVTAQKEAQHRAQQSESRYKTLLQQAAGAMFVHDFDGRIIEANQQACDILGYDSEELRRMKIADISPNFDLDHKRQIWEQLEPGRPLSFISSHRRKDGSVFPVEVRLAALAVDNQKLIMALASDITERQRIETALQESEARYRNFAEKLPLGIIITDEGMIKYVNQALIDLIGYTADELLDKPFLPVVHAEDRPWLQELHQRRMRGENVLSTYVVRVTRKDGQTRQWEIRASVIDWKGRLCGFGIIADITERIRLDEKLRDSVHQLEEKELSKTRFLAAAGHDLRQPVAAANLFVDALKLSCTTERQMQLTEKLEQSMGVFSSLLERLLDISKFDAGLVKPKFATFNLSELFNWVEQNFAQTTRRKQLCLRLYFPLDRPLVVRTDIGLLQSVVMNLVSNAIKFTSHGAILVSARVRGDRVLLQVWDTGDGIAETDLPYIFDEFYQANNPQRSREAGLGLGLSICQRAMSLLGGKVRCRSRLGRGSVFEFDIPLNGERRQVGHLETGDGAPDETADLTLVQGKRIVVLEDDALVATGLLNLLQGLGAEALHFPAAEEALHHTEIANADFHIVDFSLSGQLTGIDFLRAVQRRRLTPLRAVVITGETSSGFISRARDIPWPVLHKPVNLARLLSSLKQQVER